MGFFFLQKQKEAKTLFRVLRTELNLLDSANRRITIEVMAVWLLYL